MKLAPITLDATTETYFDIKNLIFDTVWKFQRQHGGDFDEMVAEANLIYIKAFISHDPDRAQFTTWLYTILQRKLLDIQRTKYKQIQTYSLNDIENIYEYPALSYFPLWELLFDIDKDAKIIINLLLDLPDELQKIIISQRKSNTLSKKKIITNLAYLLGWSYLRTRESFIEIASVLNDY